jgi:hypothetical protein
MKRKDEIIVAGNGESRRGIDLEKLQERYTVFACNGAYREWKAWKHIAEIKEVKDLQGVRGKGDCKGPDILFALDGFFLQELQTVGYHEKNLIYTTAPHQCTGSIDIRHIQGIKNTSGGASISVACLTPGVKTIYLLGHDICAINGNPNHMHKGEVNCIKADEKRDDKIASRRMRKEMTSFMRECGTKTSLMLLDFAKVLTFTR